MCEKDSPNIEFMPEDNRVSAPVDAEPYIEYPNLPHGDNDPVQVEASGETTTEYEQKVADVNEKVADLHKNVRRVIRDDIQLPSWRFPATLGTGPLSPPRTSDVHQPGTDIDAEIQRETVAEYYAKMRKLKLMMEKNGVDQPTEGVGFTTHYNDEPGCGRKVLDDQPTSMAVSEDAVHNKFYLKYNGHGNTFLVDGPFDSRHETIQAQSKIDMPGDWKRDYLFIEDSKVIIPFDREESRRNLEAMRPAKSMIFEFHNDAELRKKLEEAAAELGRSAIREAPRVIDPDELTTAAAPEEPIQCRSIGEILDRACNQAAILQNLLDPILIPPSDQQVDAAEDYGSGVKNQAMRIYNLLENIMARVEI